MNYLSVCSGIEAATVAWHPLGWHAIAFSEIEKFPNSVLASHYPDTPNLGDMRDFKNWPDANVDVLVGGTPCQSFSVAGLRQGLADPRGNLALTYLAILERYRARRLVWENVPGVLSADGGRAFGAFLGGLAELGYGFAWRVLDAQYFGLAQRRKRVFVVGYLGDWRRAAAVLFDTASLRGDPAPRRSTRQDIAGTIENRARGGGGLGTNFECANGLIPTIANPLTHRMHKGVNTTMDEGQTMIPVAFDTTQITNRNNRSRPEPGDACHTLASGAHAPAVAFYNGGGKTRLGVLENGVTPPITNSKGNHGNVAIGTRVRRLTPLECERLQGFPDGYTLVEYRGKHAADGPRYKALGNSMAVPVMRWIGRRIESVC